MVEYIQLKEAQKVLRLACEEVLDLLEKGEIKGRRVRLLSTSGGYDYCTGWLIERRSLEGYLSRKGRPQKRARREQPKVHAGVLIRPVANPQVNTGF